MAQLLPPDAGEGAEDIAQEAFLRLHKQVAAHGEESVRNVPTWLFRVARNLAMDARRRKLRDQKARTKLTENAGNTAETADLAEDSARRELCERAMAELDALPGKQREVLVLRIVQDMKMREIAEVMGISISNVAYHLNSGLKSLATKLKTAGMI